MSTPPDSPAAQVRRVTAYLTVKNAAEAIAFYTSAFGARESFRLTEPGTGRVGHAELRFGDSVVMLADEYPDFGALSPATVGGSPVQFHLDVQSADHALERAVAAGATVLRPLTDEFYGERSAMVADPFGYRWMLAHKVEEVSPAEMQRRFHEALQGG